MSGPEKRSARERSGTRAAGNLRLSAGYHCASGTQPDVEPFPGWTVEKDDATIAALAVRIGVFDDFQAGMNAGRDFVLLPCADHRQARVIMLFDGCPDRGNDGWAMVTAPASHWELVERFARYVAENSGNGKGAF